jgi:hypothetical protein
MKNETKQYSISMDNVRYHSMLNAIQKEFEMTSEGTSHGTQKRMLSLAMAIIDSFASIYGEHDLKKASSAVTRKLATMYLHEN